MREEIIKLLDQYRLKEALTQMAGYAAGTSDWQLKNEIEDLQTSYNLMLQYAAKGMKDPNREEIYRKIRCTAYELTDCIYQSLEAVKGSSVYYDTMRTFAHKPTYSYAELQMMLEADMAILAPDAQRGSAEAKSETEIDEARKHHEFILDELFDKTWVSTRWSEAEENEAYNLTESRIVPIADHCVLVSAVTMSLLQQFDIRKFRFLLDSYIHYDPQVNQRALVGIALTCYYYEERIRQYPAILSRLNEMTEEEDFIQELHEVQIQLLQSARETRKIDKKMREEILPEMMKNPKLNMGMDEDTEDRNPEWEEWIDRSGITDKLRELGDLQMAGADVHMSTFSQLKHFPFFQKMAHWFYPFNNIYQNVNQLPITDDTHELSIMSLLMNGDTFCNSDKYSLCFAIQQMPEHLKRAMQQQLNRQQQEIPEDLRERLKGLAHAQTMAKFVSRQYVHDLYRFFKLWPRRHEMHDVFEDTLDLWNKPILAPALLHPDCINQLADYLFTHDNLEEAAIMYNHSLQKCDLANVEAWQKAGFVYQKLGLYDKAIHYYEQADVLAPDSAWNNRHLAQCYRKKGIYGQALDYYKKVEQAQPDNLNLTQQIGQCLMAIEKYEEALAYFFKVEYLDKKPQKARRAIGWCSFITGKHQQAKKFYDLLIAEPKPTLDDWLNAGHVYYALGETEKSIEYYRKAQNLCDSHSEFVKLFLNDKKELLKQGFSEVNLSILPDELL